MFIFSLRESEIFSQTLCPKGKVFKPSKVFLAPHEQLNLCKVPLNALAFESSLKPFFDCNALKKAVVKDIIHKLKTVCNRNSDLLKYSLLL